MFSHQLTILLACLFVNFETMAENDCLVGACTRRYIDLMDELILQPTTSFQYCRILNEYRKCLDGTRSACISFLDFHSAQTTTQQDWKQYECSTFEQEIEQIEQSGDLRNSCPQIPSSHLQTCAIYGYGHIRQIDGQIQTCWPSGAQTLADNRFFLIQATLDSASSEKKQLAIVSRITIIFRSIPSCSQTLFYQTDLDDSQLPLTFTDGTHSIGAETDPWIKIEQEDEWTVKITAKHLSTEIYVQRVKSQLSLILNAPERVLSSDLTKASKQMCFHGCPYKSHNLRQALADSIKYGQCYFNQSPTINAYRAYDKCQEPRARNHLHSTCAFDLIFDTQQDQQAMLYSWHLLIRRLRQFHSLRSKPLHNIENDKEELCLNSSAIHEINLKLLILSVLIVLR